MPWDKTLPQTTTKLRLTPSISQTNWAAIEEGSVPFDFLTLSEQLADPARANSTGHLFSKEDAVSAFTELFYQNDDNPAMTSQLTGLDLTATAIADGDVYGITTPWGLILNWGTGVVPAAAYWTVTFKVAYTATPIVIPTKYLNASITGPSNVSTTACRVYGSIASTVSFFAIGV